MKLLRQVGEWMWEERKFWIAPIVGAMLLVGALVAFSNASPLAPFIYSMW